TYILGRRIWDVWSAAIGTAIVLASATFLAWSTTAHPDMQQLLWLLLGLWVATSLAGRSSTHQAGTTTLAAIGAVYAGLAFATKYAGELLLPMLWVSVAIGRRRTASEGLPRGWPSPLGPLALDIGVTTGVFLAVFFAVDPSAIREWRSFLYQMTLEAGLAHGGHLLQSSSDPGGWLRLLAGGDVLGPIGLIVALASLAVWTLLDLRSLLRLQARGDEAKRLPLEMFTAGYLVFLLIWIGDLQSRYALPVMPGLGLMAGAGITWLAGRSRVWTLPALAVLLLALLPLGSRTLAYEQVQANRMHSPGVHDRIDAGRWLAARMPADAPILADAYSYVPPAFTNVEESFGLTRARIQSGSPRIIITDSSIRNRFLDPALASGYVDGAAAYREIAATYQALESGSIACYAPLQRFGPVGIYGRVTGC
ncbi:MAG TPA: hypothetical protein VK821_16875, partial [Dehalococcoidia bacterium]|nr:hypothetical protein [Dehalococcoidia bacterium]